MRTHVKWSDYMLTAVIRCVSGALIGLLLSVVLAFFGNSVGRYHMGRARSPLVDFIEQGNYRPLVLWFGAWSVGGAVAAVASIPRWQTPWYKGVLGQDDENPPDEPVA